MNHVCYTLSPYGERLCQVMFSPPEHCMDIEIILQKSFFCEPLPKLLNGSAPLHNMADNQKPFDDFFLWTAARILK